MKPTSDQIDIRSIAAAKELQEYVDTENATDDKVEPSYLELRRALSLGSKFKLFDVCDFKGATWRLKRHSYPP